MSLTTSSLQAALTISIPTPAVLASLDNVAYANFFAAMYALCLYARLRASTDALETITVQTT